MMAQDLLLLLSSFQELFVTTFEYSSRCSPDRAPGDETSGEPGVAGGRRTPFPRGTNLARTRQCNLPRKFFARFIFNMF